MNAAELQVAFLKSKFLRRFYFYPSIASTNDKAKELASLGAEEGTAVIAEEQTAGRGRSDRVWFSPPGLGVYVSMIYRPEVPVEAAFGLLAASSMAVAAVADALEPREPVGVKWPNDLLFGDRKVCGVLSEIGVSAGQLDWCVVGLGLNVNHQEEDFPPALRDRATSLRIACGRPFDTTEILTLLVERCGEWYERFMEEGPDPVLEAWRARSVIIGKMVRLETAGETYVGTAQAIEPDGGLRIRLEGGAEEVLRAGDVHLVQVR